MWGKQSPRSCGWGWEDGAAALENSLAGPQTMKHRVLYDPAIPLLSIYPREMETQVQAKTRAGMLTAALRGPSIQWGIISPKKERGTDTC